MQKGLLNFKSDALSKEEQRSVVGGRYACYYYDKQGNYVGANWDNCSTFFDFAPYGKCHCTEV